MSNVFNEIARYNRIRQEAITKLGGKCVICLSAENLEFDHIDPKTKSYAISEIWSVTDLFWMELEKCQLLCHDCHVAKSASERYTVPHGGGVCGKHHCKCIPCKAKKAEYMLSYKRRYRFS